MLPLLKKHQIIVGKMNFTSFILNLTVVISFTFLSCKNTAENELKISEHYASYRVDTNRFIAHAGGAINGNTYTNTLEALDFNYAKGFRFFELDLIRTADHQIVASHDWEMWKKQSNYQGETPVNLEVFLENKILNQYTPLDISAINEWFLAHQDAFLVTDKINNPSLVANQFIAKDRLIMELFSLEAIQEAQNLGIYRIMASETVLNSFGDKRIEKLLENNIDYVTFSRLYIEDHLAFLKQLKKKDIKAFVYNLRYSYNEDYVVKYEMDYIYGIYADEWSF